MTCGRNLGIFVRTGRGGGRRGFDVMSFANWRTRAATWHAPRPRRYTSSAEALRTMSSRSQMLGVTKICASDFNCKAAVVLQSPAGEEESRQA